MWMHGLATHRTTWKITQQIHHPIMTLWTVLLSYWWKLRPYLAFTKMNWKKACPNIAVGGLQQGAVMSPCLFVLRNKARWVRCKSMRLPQLGRHEADMCTKLVQVIAVYGTGCAVHHCIDIVLYWTLQYCNELEDNECGCYECALCSIDDQSS